MRISDEDVSRMLECVQRPYYESPIWKFTAEKMLLDLLDARTALAQTESALDSANDRLQEALTELAALKEAE